MPDAPYDLVIRGGRVGTAAGDFAADVGVRGETIAAIGLDLPKGAREIDARGKLVLPGGIDAHAHIEQLTASGLMNADTWETATAAAACGGTTTVIAFAAQHVGMKLPKVIADYAKLAERGALVDYAFHLIIADPTPETVERDIPAALAAGHGSLKVFMTYDRLKVEDERLLDVLAAARAGGALTCVHPENHGMLAFMAKRLVARGYTAPRYHAVSHPRIAEAEAINRLAAMSALTDAPVMAFHVSTAEGAAVVRRVRGEGVKLYAETCPQYLFFTADDLDRPGLEGGKWMCSPPLRAKADQEALWRALELGDLQTVTSDHAPYRFDKSGKLAAGPKASFKQIANGLPGLQVRLPLLFDAMVSKGRLGLAKFVELTATAPARIYNLAGKGAIAPGADADIAIWDPKKRVTLTASLMKDNAGYTPFEGRKVKGWPERVLVRGREVAAGGEVATKPGSGRFLARSGGEGARPGGAVQPEMDPARNFGARLL